MDDYEQMSVFEQIVAGLKDAIDWTNGEIELKVTEL